MAILPPKKGDPDKKLWIKCRAKKSCEGNQAVLVFEWQQPLGGVRKRYRCLTCKGTFHITN
jgi:hypothetical protein